MESSGKSRIVSGSQEVIGSIPICSTQIIKGLQSFRFAALSFLPEFCQKDEEKERPNGQNNSHNHFWLILINQLIPLEF